VFGDPKKRLQNFLKGDKKGFSFGVFHGAIT
jgi:hypothetical protein